MCPTDSSALWRAVADPTRRRLIELLRDGPHTTGALCAAFSVSRFAVMKHLDVLERAGLLTFDRRGRERWNRLVPEPFADLERRWPKAEELAAIASSREAPTASRGSAAPPAAALMSADPRREKHTSARLAESFLLEIEAFFDASPARVFDTLTVGVATWWTEPYLSSPDTTNVVLEAQLGGRFYEEWGHREGALRATVTAIKRDERLELSGAFPDGALLPSVVRIALVRREGGTLLTLTHRGLVERPDQEAVAARMWRTLIKANLRNAVV
jgi:DNA-binding transcriptional ArsR family regulator/uncharacterized protein YndB with AHSA1/START domain